MTAQCRADEIAAFRAFVDCSVSAAVVSGLTTFTSLLRHLPSVYPTELLASLNRLDRLGAINHDVVQVIRCQISARPTEPPEGRSLLPLPHPLDFEWRFTPDVSRDLLDAACALTHANGQILLFGTPGLAVEALTLPISRPISFLGEDNCVTRRLIALNQAIGSPLSVTLCSAGLPLESADAILLDPPWYMDFIRPMLSAASAACRRGGVVLVSLPSVGTRPSVLADREKVLRFAGRLGLDLVEVRTLAIAYDTPFFETNALSAAGVFAPSRWRRGDLVILRKSRRSARLSSGASGRRREWVEVLIGRMRLFIRADRSASGLPRLIPLVSGGILPSVSRRDPRRQPAQVWTSGNRVFRTDNPELVIEAALAASGAEIGPGVQPRLWGNVAERDAVERVGFELEALSAKEAAEERGLATSAIEWGMPWRSSSTSCYDKLPATVSG